MLWIITIRDALLTAIDGIMYGDDPKHGVVQGRTFVHPVFRLSFTVPEGFTMQNGTEAVSISGPNAQALFSTRAYEGRSEEHTSELQSLMRISYAVFCLKKKKKKRKSK